MKLLTLACVLVACLFSVKSFARDDIQTLPIQALLETSKAKQALLDIPLYFADQSHNTIKTKYGEVITNKKTNAFNKTDREACEWVMLSALKALQERAVREGMNAVVNIQSYYKKREFVSQTEYQCGAGTFIAGVALKGTLVKL
ncbi:MULTISPECIES: excinuclease ABC subunit A [unclassified Pseudoalteromonas]|uniref:excinuclease ABC subunit A n=1 Tax=unclassified Pseudoalteromonas TaxID=194690 RepID=UPI00101F13C0|nr:MULTISPECIES: excinuclease ABC subunit A [unclassified Pseudoalteromonas]MCG9708348.1 excinuclease ABC subunit A [Pseudoalteromonas sp. Isolate3]RZD20169.1 excinuclease ABC subunit A [Pseudoalteromonas sp. MEBiC 03485]